MSDGGALPPLSAGGELFRRIAESVVEGQRIRGSNHEDNGSVRCEIPTRPLPFLDDPSLHSISGQSVVEPGSKVFLQSMHGFEADLTVALIASNLPVTIVKERKDAELEVSGRHSQRRGPAFGQEVLEEATITITNIQTGVVIDAYTVTAETTEKLAPAPSD